MLRRNAMSASSTITGIGPSAATLSMNRAPLTGSGPVLKG